MRYFRNNPLNSLLQAFFGHRKNENKLRESDEKFRVLFHQTPVGIVLEDYSTIKRTFDQLALNGADEIKQYFHENPDELTKSIKSIKLIDANNTQIKLFGTNSFEEYRDYEVSLKVWNDPHWRQYYIGELTDLAEGKKIIRGETEDAKADGTPLHVRVVTGIMPGHEEDWSEIISTHEDITDRKRIEEELKKTRDSLAELSVTDALTGLANRRRFDEVLKAEFHRMHRIKAPISVIMIDIDYFKPFNDTYGHLEGDECLRVVGAVIKKTIQRSQDLAARYGGEEFSCILPETDHDATVAIATNIKDNIAAMNYRHEGSQVADHITASVGVATVVCDEDGSPEQVVKLADERLYWAKENGRNRVGHDGLGSQ